MTAHWQVALFKPPFTDLTYELPPVFPEVVPGLRVMVPVRGSLRPAVCLHPCGKPEFATRPMLWPLERTPILNEQWMHMARDLAARQMAPLGHVLSVLIPRALRTTDVTFACDVDGLPRKLSPKQLSGLDASSLQLFCHAWNGGGISVRLHPRKEADARVATLTVDPPWPVRPGAVKQERVLDHLYQHGSTPLGGLTQCLGAGTKGIVDRLVDLGLVRWDDGMAAEDEEVLQEPLLFEPSPEQRQAVDELSAAMREWKGNAGVVHGVTGSGKTHVYLTLVEKALEEGRSCLLLAPEVALAVALFGAVRSRFGDAVSRLYHGYQSPSLRQRVFSEVGGSGSPMVVVGTRSALFLPFTDLGLVILDEEHDESFKQEERLAYQAKEVAWTRVRQACGMLVLGSATPDVKTFHSALAGKIPLVSMHERVGSGRLPEVALEDISAHKDLDRPLSQAVEEELLSVLERGEQAIIMLNRRGYSPVMYCTDCGEAAKCPNCDVGLTYHKQRQQLVCHYCGLTVAYPALCASCGGTRHLPMGGGTERVEEYLARVLPEDSSVLRMDRDSTRRQEVLEDILHRFSEGEAQVLVGTQMLSKGHHFPGVTLVIVVDGDLGLNLPDYRSAERTFQLLVQVSGRAGRGDRPGKVIIQTRNPGHPIWKDVLEADYRSFYDREIGLRERFGYPPFSFLALVRLSHGVDDDAAAGLIAEAGQVLRGAAQRLGISVLGPVPSPLARLNNRNRYNCLLKGADWPSLRGAFGHLLNWNPCPDRLRMRLDLDPVTML